VVKILGIQISKDLKWDVHIGDIIKSAGGRLYMLSTLKRFGLSLKDLMTIYVGFVRPLLDRICSPSLASGSYRAAALCTRAHPKAGMHDIHWVQSL
jgi:hypothetical protein